MINRRRGTKKSLGNNGTNKSSTSANSGRGSALAASLNAIRSKSSLAILVFSMVLIYRVAFEDTSFANGNQKSTSNSYQYSVVNSGASTSISTPAVHSQTSQQSKQHRVATQSEVPRLSLSQNVQNIAGKGSQEPVLLEDWSLPAASWSKGELMKRYGHFPQYLKDMTVQVLSDHENNSNKCVLPGTLLSELLTEHDLLFFTNNKENDPFMEKLRHEYRTPEVVQHIDGFEVFSALSSQKSHSFHRHGESWLGQVEGRRQWWFLPPNTNPPPQRVNACGYLTGESPLPPGATTITQNPGEVIWFPTDWYHATCALDGWTVGIGAQMGQTIRQNFPELKAEEHAFTPNALQATLKGCLGVPELKALALMKPKKEGDKDWKWFDGDLNAYYNSLEKDHNRDPTKPGDYAVHRWLGPKRSTEEHYKLLENAAQQFHPKASNGMIRVLDGGCGLGSALMWLETRHPLWKLTGYTVSEEQNKFIQDKLPAHKFQVHLESYDNLQEGAEYDFVYSIEALIHSPDAYRTMKIWADHLAPGGVLAIIDDFVAEGADKEAEGMQEFAKSWLANSLFTTNEMIAWGREFGLELAQDIDLDAVYKIVELNYRNKIPDIKPFGGRTHQGWMGSKWRQRLTVEGKVVYHMVVLQKPKDATRRYLGNTCDPVPQTGDQGSIAEFTTITPQLMSGKGANGGSKMACISGWYCCNKGTDWWDELNEKRTDNTAFLKLDRDLFGHYIDVFAKHLNEFYATYPAETKEKGRFLDIGGTGSTSSGMTQVTSKFQHFAGPLEYWKLDIDTAAKELERTVYCDVDDCPAAEDCSFDVTFSHTVLEHAQRPWKAFDTVARITKKGGLTMHLVPFSYQYHATPDDNYRFSHKALITLLEDRGFEVLEVGYDICTKPEHMRKRVDEHYDVIWLTYVVGRKL